MRLLLIEDDKRLCDSLGFYLERRGFTVDICHDGEEGLLLIQEQAHDLILLDRMLPSLDGASVLKKIRAGHICTPVILLTALGEVNDRIEGLNCGADDYLVKPFSPRELVARVRALLRRTQLENEPQREVLEFGDLVIDVSGHKVLVKGEEIDLTASEFKLLTTLARYPGRVYSRMELVEKVLGYDFEGYERTIDSHVKNLRAKLGDNPRKPKWLHTVSRRSPSPSREAADTAIGSPIPRL